MPVPSAHAETRLPSVLVRGQTLFLTGKSINSRPGLVTLPFSPWSGNLLMHACTSRSTVHVYIAVGCDVLAGGGRSIETPGPNRMINGSIGIGQMKQHPSFINIMCHMRLLQLAAQRDGGRGALFAILHCVRWWIANPEKWRFSCWVSYQQQNACNTKFK